MIEPRRIIAEAWNITATQKPIRRWGFLSAFLETLLDAKLLIYQGYFAYSYWQGNPIGFFRMEEILLEYLPFSVFVAVMILLGMLLVLEFFVPHICLGAIIGLAAKFKRGEELRGGLVLGIYNFLPLFAVREIFLLSKLTTVITISSLVIRYIEGDVKYAVIWFIFGIFTISNFLRFFASFAEEAIVIRKEGVFHAVGKSMKIIISYLGNILFLFILMFIISLRILINAIMVILIPGSIVGLGLLFALFLPAVVSYSISTVIGIAIICIASYFFAYLHVFKQTVWTLTYLELSEKKDLDVIIDENITPEPVTESVAEEILAESEEEQEEDAHE